MSIQSIRRSPRSSWLLLCGVLWVVACRPRTPSTPPTPEPWRAEVLALETRIAEDPDDAAAWRDLAHIRWIHLGQADVARPMLRANATERGDLASHVSLLVLLDERGQDAAVGEAATAILKQAAAVAPDDPLRPFADDAARFAARTLVATHGTVADDDPRFVAMFDALEGDVEAGRAWLPFRALQPLLSQRAAIARRHGQDSMRYFARAGCVQDWAVGPMQGHLGALELPRVDVRRALVPDTGAVLAQLSCVVRVWNPTAAPGVRRLRSEVDVTGTTLALQVAAEFPARIYVDGHLVHRTDTTERYDAQRAYLTLHVAPGRHTLDMVTAIPDERAWIMVRATDGHTQPVNVRPAPTLAAPAGPTPEVQREPTPWSAGNPPLSHPLYAPLRALLIGHDAVAEGDSDLGEAQLRWLRGAKRFAEGHSMRARLHRADPSRGSTVSLSLERKALQQALALDPKLDRARLRLLRIDLERGETERVAEALAALPNDRLQSLDGYMLRYQVHQRRDSEYAAEQALSQAAALNPHNCRVLRARRALAKERDDVGTEDALAKKLAACSGSLAIRARLAERRGDTARAQTLWGKILARVPDDLNAHQALSRLAGQAGDHAAARAHLQATVALNPFRVDSHIAMADLAASRGEPAQARQHLHRALQQIPHSNVLRRAGASLGIPDDLSQWRIDGQAVLAEFRESGVTYEGVSEVLVLDRSIVRVYENGGQRQIVHIVALLQSKDALDRYGEIEIPDGAQLLALHTIKPDGRRLEPEVIGGKEGLSLRHLEVGDAVEYEFVVEEGPSGPMPGYVDVSTFRFQSLDVPYHRSELQVIHPEGMDVRTDRRNDPPQEQVQRRDGVVSRLWRADAVPRLGVEPGHRSLLDELPNVHVYTPPVLTDYLGSLAVQIRETQRANLQLRTLVRRLTRPHGNDDAAKLMVLWRWVADNIEDQGDLTVPATVTLASRGGNRMMLLRAMLQLAGIDARLWLARDAYGTKPLPGGHPMLSDYGTALLAVHLPGAATPQMVLTASAVMPPGYVPPGLRGTDALHVQLSENEPASGRVRLPPLEGLTDRRQWDLAISIGADGGGRVEGTITLTGMEAVYWRQALHDIDRDRRQEVFLQAELGWLGGAEVESLAFEGQEALAEPLRLKFFAHAPGLGVVQGGDVVLRATPMPLNPAARFAGLPRRTTGLVIPYAPQQVVNLQLTAAHGRFVELPPPADVRSPFGTFERTIVGGKAGDAKISLQVRSTLRPGVIAPEAYGRLASFARQIDAAEQAMLRAR